jgi:hypothetical protein
MIKAGIVDLLKVVRTALVDTSGVASLLTRSRIILRVAWAAWAGSNEWFKRAGHKSIFFIPSCISSYLLSSFCVRDGVP